MMTPVRFGKVYIAPMSPTNNQTPKVIEHLKENCVSVGSRTVTQYTKTRIDNGPEIEQIVSQEFHLVTDEDLLQIAKDIKWVPGRTKIWTQELINLTNRKLDDPVERNRFWKAFGPYVRYQEAIGNAIRL